MKKVLLTRKIHGFAMKDLAKKYEVLVHLGATPMSKRSLLSKISGIDGLVCFPYDRIDKEVIDAARNLCVISTFSVGYDHIDVKYARNRGIKIGYTPDVLTDATADLAVTLMLDLMRRVTEGDRLIRAGKWKEIHGAHEYVGAEIAGKTLGILGMGRIGGQMAKRAQAFGMNVIYHNRHKMPTKAAKYCTLDSLLKKSDVLSIHVPYTKQTHEMINLSAIKKMKKGAFIVNTARGKIIKESDLITSLKKKIIAGAALDVFESEPIGKSNQLTKLENVVLAPHIGSSTDKTREKMAELTVKNLNLGIRGKEPVYSVR